MSQLILLSKKLIQVKEKVCLRFELFKTFKAANKNNPRAHSPQQNKKALLPISKSPVRSQGQ